VTTPEAIGQMAIAVAVVALLGLLWVGFIAVCVNMARWLGWL